MEARPLPSVLFISLATYSLTFIMPSYCMADLRRVKRRFLTNLFLRNVRLNFRRYAFGIYLIISYASYALRYLNLNIYEEPRFALLSSKPHTFGGVSALTPIRAVRLTCMY